MSMNKAMLLGAIVCSLGLLIQCDDKPTSVPGKPATWEKAFGGAGFEKAYSVIQAHDFGYIIAGETTSFGNGSGDVYLVKINASGELIWEKTFGGAMRERAAAVAPTPDGGYIVVGTTVSFGAGSHDVYVIKTGSSGDSVWARTFGGINDDDGCAVTVTRDGGYLVAGSTSPFGVKGSRVYLVKIDNSGNLVWETALAGDDAGCGYSVIPGLDAGYIVAGKDMLGIYMAKIDETGSIIWQKTVGDLSQSIGHSVILDSDGGFVIAGMTDRDGSSSSAGIVLLKTDSSGDMVWEKTFGGNTDRANSVALAPEGGYIIAGESALFGEGDQDAYLMKIDESGNKLWEKIFGGTAYDGSCCIAPTAGGGYIVVGGTDSFGSGGADFYVLKLDESCEL